LNYWSVINCMPTMDFCYDLKDLLDKKGYQYVLVFMQTAKKKKESHFDVLYKVSRKGTIKLFDELMQEATSSFDELEGNSEVRSQKHFMHYYASRFKEQGFDYVLFATKNDRKEEHKKVSVFFKVRNKTNGFMMAEALYFLFKKTEKKYVCSV